MNNDVVVINLDKPRQLRYGVKALKFIEKSLNTKITKLNFNELSIDDVLNLLLAGLIHEDNSLNLEKIEDLVDKYSEFQTVIEKISQAFEVAFSKK